MRADLPYPASFPSKSEEQFIKLVLSPDAEFTERWAAWRESIVFDDIDFATLRLLPVLYLRLSKLGLEDDEVTGRIRGVYKLAWFRNQRLFEKARKVVALCHEEGIPILLLKGLALLSTVYRNPGARFSEDADLLVHEQDVPKVFSLLHRHGWRHMHLAAVSATGEFREQDAKAMHAAALSDGGDITVDLHWHAFHVEIDHDALRMLCLRDPRPGPRLDESHWRNSVAAELKGLPVRVLSIEDMLLHVIVHGAGWNVHRPLRWVVDAAQIIDTGRIDWNRFVELVGETEYKIHAYLALRYLRERIALEIPAVPYEAIKNMPTNRWQRRKYYRISDGRIRFLGHFPKYWYLYWKHESNGNFVSRCKKFPSYMRDRWEIKNNEDIVWYIFGKYKKILRDLLSVGKKSTPPHSSR